MQTTFHQYQKRTDGRTDTQTDGGRCNISQAYGAAGDNKLLS